MSGESSNAPAVVPDATQPVTEAKNDAPAVAAPAVADGAPAADTEPASAPASTETVEKKESDKPAEASTDKVSDSPAEKPDVEMTDSAAPAVAPAADAETNTASAPADTAAPTPNKSKAKRKSVGGAADTKGKKLNKKQSKARITHLDAQPGDHYFVKLKGFPQWPVIICDEDMLPQSLLRSRPVTAKRADGTYRDDYADGAKKAGDRTFPVMYLHTNEFGWVPNTDLIELDPTTVKDMKSEKMRKDLQAAHDLAAESHPLSFYKEVLHQFQEDLLEQEKSKAAKAATPKSKKTKTATSDDEDVEMADAPEEDDEAPKEKKVKKRKAEDSAETPQRSDSVKKPKIKLTTNSTPKTNGTTPSAKPAKAAAEGKPPKTKSKKPKETEEKVENEPLTPKEPELSPEEKHARKEKEVLFLRHKLQKGLLTRDQEPKEEEMESMSTYIAKLEGLPDLEVSIIRSTKINKVLKAILKLNNIPKDDEFQFKPRSQFLLDKWNKLLAVDDAPATTEGTNGVKATKEGPKTNGVKPKADAEPEKPKEETKDEPKDADKTEGSAAPVEKPAGETKVPEAVEASA